MRRIHADLMLLLAATIWGVAFVFQKTAMDYVGPCTFIAARGIVAALALLPLAVSESRQAAGSLTPRLPGMAVGAGVVFFAGAVFQQAGLLTATVSNTGFLTALYVVVTPFIAWGWAKQRPTAHIWLAVLLSFTGTWLLGGGTLAGFNRGDLLVAICAVFWAAHMTIVSSSSRFSRPVAFTAIQFAVVGVLGLISAFVFETPTASGVRAALPSIAFVGVLASAVTFTLLAMAMKRASAAEAAIIVSLETIIAAAAGAVMLGERMSAVAWCGAALIVAAILIVQLTSNSKPTTEVAP